MKYLFILLFVSTLVNAQKLSAFPPDQHSYLGGREAFYRDFQKILLEKKLTPCENKKEYFNAYIVVKEDETAVLYEGKNIKAPENQCAVALTREVIKSMGGWMVAKIDGQQTIAVADYFIFPDAFFDNFKSGYLPEKEIVKPEYPGGIKSFKEHVNHRIDVSDFYVKGEGKVTVIVKFTVNKEGFIENVMLEKSSGLKEYDEMIVSSVASLDKKWTPANIHGLPTTYRFTMPLSFSGHD